MSARLLKDGQIVFAGVGIPLLAATLAQAHALPGPDHPVRRRRHRALHRARQAAALHQRAALHASRQHGAAQHRRAAAAAARLCRCRLHGRRADRPVRQSQFARSSATPPTRKRACPAPAAATISASLAEMIVAMKHEKRRFVGSVDFVTSPGFLRGGTQPARRRPCRPAACIASSPTSAIFGFDDDDAGA